jgi:hypothetical protein
VTSQGDALRWSAARGHAARHWPSTVDAAGTLASGLTTPRGPRSTRWVEILGQALVDVALAAQPSDCAARARASPPHLRRPSTEPVPHSGSEGIRARCRRKRGSARRCRLRIWGAGPRRCARCGRERSPGARGRFRRVPCRAGGAGGTRRRTRWVRQRTCRPVCARRASRLPLRLPMDCGIGDWRRHGGGQSERRSRHAPQPLAPTRCLVPTGCRRAEGHEVGTGRARDEVADGHVHNMPIRPNADVFLLRDARRFV